jgi:hypothetical protein
LEVKIIKKNNKNKLEQKKSKRRGGEHQDGRQA